MAKFDRNFANRSKSKGRRFQKKIIEALSIRLGLKILAEPPTKPGERAGGAVYVAEGYPVDLKNRRMGQSGTDIALMSDTARESVAFDGIPFTSIECKKRAGFSLDGKFWEGIIPQYLSEFLEQANEHNNTGRNEAFMLVLASDNIPPVVFVEFLPDKPIKQYSYIDGYFMIPFDIFVSLLDGYSGEKE